MGLEEASLVLVVGVHGPKLPESGLTLGSVWGELNQGVIVVTGSEVAQGLTVQEYVVQHGLTFLQIIVYGLLDFLVAVVSDGLEVCYGLPASTS